MSISIYDIAKKAQVSPSTVSRALQDHPRIGEKTRARIKILAKEMGYIPSAVAKSLSDNKTWTIGVVIPNVADPFMADIVDGVEAIAQEAGYSIFLSNSRKDPQREIGVIETFHRRRVDAILIVASSLEKTYGAQLNQLDAPIVLVGSQQVGERFHNISEDSVNGGIEATNHLLELGHRRIGYIGSIERPKSNSERLRGYKIALENAGVAVQPELISMPDSNNDFERGQLGLAEILQAGATAVFCYNDRTAIGLINACDSHDVSVPKQLSVVGFDDIRLAPYLRPALTTIHQPGVKMGRLATQMTLNVLAGKEVENQILPCNLIVRQSTAVLK